MQQKVLLYYFFVPVPDPHTVMLWQRELCERNNLKGRIIVSEHGINGTLGGELKDVKQYVRAMKQHPLFAKTQYKWSEGKGNEFPKLSVKVRKELVTLNPEEEFDVFDQGTALRPKQWDKLLRERDDIVILDARNDYESELGYFEGAITPKIRAFREIKETLDQMDKDTPVATYCTGDVRCEYLSAYMKHKGFKEVYHLEGGIVTYGKEFGNKGLWKGRCFVFDQRMNVAFGDDVEELGRCFECEAVTDHQISCIMGGCSSKTLVCDTCTDKYEDKLICSNCAEANSSTVTGSHLRK